jgi:hypothetical protein
MCIWLAKSRKQKNKTTFPLPTIAMRKNEQFEVF